METATNQDLQLAYDFVLRKYKIRHLPFGGVQLLMIGDLQQLAPVVKDALGEQVSWRDIKFAVSHLKFLRRKVVNS